MSHWKPLDASLRHAVMVTNAGGWRAPLLIRMGRIGDLLDRRAYPVDLRDHLIFPGLINAHNHLQLNAVPPLVTRTIIAALRLRHGALKNLLAGCTGVAHHDDWHPAFAAPDFPSAVLRLTYLKAELGADSILFFDHNFFDREADMISMLEIMAKLQMPWWCYARSDALLNLSDATWRLIRKSRLRMAYIGAESRNGQMLKDICKGTRPDQTLEVAELCHRHGMIPELSFMVAPLQHSEEETEGTFEFIREVKRINPQSEIIVYIYTPLPDSSRRNSDRGRRASAPLLDVNGDPVIFPRSPEEWMQPRWVDYACHADASWLTDKLRRRIQDFVAVLRCRYPTVQDLCSPVWAKRSLSTIAGWRYRQRRYDRPWELNLARTRVRLRMPQASGA